MIDGRAKTMTKKQKTALRKILLSAGLLILLQCIPASAFSGLDGVLFPGAGRVLRLTCYLADYLVIGGQTLKKALRGIRKKQLLDENFLMALATVGAMALAIYENGDYLEAIAVMLFYQIGELFESVAVGRSRRNISELMDIRPDYANIEADGHLTRVDPETVAVGTVIVVQPGEKVPIDGVVTEGASSLNTAALTGESVPRDVKPGEPVVSGCVNMTGVLKIRTTREFGESTASRILDLVENASSRKSKSENFISRFARVYTPAVCAAALALFLVPPTVRLILGLAPEFGSWLYRALSFLVVSCPCALVISIPLSFFAGIGGASRAGILVKGSNYLEALSRVDTVVFDKTGTLTQGVFQVTGIHHASLEEEKLLYYAAHAESASSHPISRSIRQAHGAEPDSRRVTEIEEKSGHGVTAKVDGIPVAAGNGKLMASLGIPYRDCGSAGTVVHMAVDGSYAGHILISDQVKPTASQAVAELKKRGVSRVVMLTGDGEKAAAQTARELGIGEYYASLLPGDKVEKVEALLLAEKKGRKLAFAGDGINDAPVLSRADVGIAMGAMGSDAAIEAADVVLMDDDPRKLVQAMGIARKTMAIVYQNIVFAIGIKLLCLLLVALGLAGMWLAVFADVGVMVLAVLNAIRALFVKKIT